MRRIRLSAALSLLATILMSTAAPAQNAALSGTVSSDEEGAMDDTHDVTIGWTNNSMFAYVADGDNGLRIVMGPFTVYDETNVGG